MKAGPLIALGAEPRIRVRIGDPDRLARLRDGPGDPDPDREPDLADALAGRDPGPELLPFAIDDVDRRAIRADHADRRVGDDPEQRIEVGERHEPAGHIEERVEVAAPGATAALAGPAVGAARAPRVRSLRPAPLPAPAIEGLPAHDGSSWGICASTGPTLAAIRSRSI